MSSLSDFLRTRKEDIVRVEDVAYELIDATEGPLGVRSKELEIVDFNRLLDAIDDFEETFK